jgi:chaperonin GroES
MKAFGEFVVLKVEEASTKSEGGIVLPEQARQQDPIGTVVSIGHHVDAQDQEGWNAETKKWETIIRHIQEGDRVIFNAVAASRIEVKGEEYVVLNEGDILVVLEEDE